MPTISSAVVVAPASTPSAVVGATAMHGRRGGIGIVFCIISASSLPPLSPVPVNWSVALGNLTQLFVNLHPFQTKLLHLLEQRKTINNTKKQYVLN